MPKGKPRSPAPILRVLALVGTLLFGRPGFSLAGDDVKKLLRLPLGPGSVALLANHTREPSVVSRLKAAIGSSSSPVRSVAARVIGLGALTEMLPDVRAALETESDAEAAREEIRTLCAVGGPTFDPTVLEAVKRFAPRLDGEAVRIIGRVRGIEALPLYFSTLRELSLSSSDRKAFFRLASRGNRDLLFAAVSLAFGRTDIASWRAILAVAAEQDAALNEAVLLQALRSEDPVFRGETAWYLAKIYRGAPPPNAARVLDAVSGERTEQAAAMDPEQRFGAEMLRRVLGTAPVEDEGWLACLETNPTCHLDSDFLESPLVEYLTPREREAVERRNKANMPPELRARLAKKEGEKAAKTPSDTLQTDAPLFRQITGLPRGIANDLVEIGGCKSTFSTRRLAIAQIEFRSDGLPRHVSLLGTPPKSECRQVAESLFLMSAAPSDARVPKNAQFVYVAFFDPDCLVCNEESKVATPRMGAEAEVLRVRAKVKPPKLVKKPEPIYPTSARQSGQQGVSIYEAIISRTGCVRDIRVVQSSYPILDVNGMEGIAHWRYAPATLDGVPVEVYLTVTVTFQLPKP